MTYSSTTLNKKTTITRSGQKVTDSKTTITRSTQKVTAIENNDRQQDNAEQKSTGCKTGSPVANRSQQAARLAVLWPTEVNRLQDWQSCGQQKSTGCETGSPVANRSQQTARLAVLWPTEVNRLQDWQSCGQQKAGTVPEAENKNQPFHSGSTLVSVGESPDTSGSEAVNQSIT